MDNDLETIFSAAHELHDIIFYDRREGKYYNKRTDMYLSDEEWEKIRYHPVRKPEPRRPKGWDKA